jgi:hypothetical protein
LKVEPRYEIHIDGQPLLVFNDITEAKRKARDLAKLASEVATLINYRGLARNEYLRWHDETREWVGTDALSTPPCGDR